ncbi:putative nucleotidyltransferase [Oikeobacillus pervagus]|uniref:tRNA(Met) cytidine acetate ligase n=1 Tax=Oikeobacillus pervagus TaxID=1325931 RepID=A0AAJ1SYM6_9BACI|nr:nucleotidyltransferase [Oikeobacillus pervagus]MDQ0215224.1 putative nucleotidyltransferase [Oikeobacillus pervagus]
MKSVGIVVEYNPFHNGHFFHASKAREIANADCVIAVMSGHFLQRGEPALTSKWARAHMALQSGVDLVVELPYAFSTQRAERFAFGAIHILHQLFCKSFCFGSESGEVQDFEEMVQLTNNRHNDIQKLIQLHMSQGSSYPKAQSLAYEQLFHSTAPIDLTKPNNILGYHYVQANQQFPTPMIPLTITRKNAHYHDEIFSSKHIASATSIRKALLSTENGIDEIAPYVPKATFLALQHYLQTYGSFHYWEKYWPFLQYKLLSSSPLELRKLYEIEEGIEYRLIEWARKTNTFEHFMKQVKTKRYTWTRIQRMLIHILTNTSKEEMNKKGNSPEYIRLLGMNETGKTYLNQIKKQVSIPLITKISAFKELIAFDIKATKIYSFALAPEFRQKLLESEWKQSPLIVSSPTGKELS